LEDGSTRACFDLDLIASLLVASCDKFTFEEIAERMTALKKSVGFEVLGGGDRVLSSDAELRSALRNLLEEGLCNDWIEAVTMRYADRYRASIPGRVRRVLADNPSLRDTMGVILTSLKLTQSH
jgi:hypothetical protein